MDFSANIDLGNKIYSHIQFMHAEELHKNGQYFPSCISFFQCLQSGDPEAVILRFRGAFSRFQINDVYLDIQGSITDNYVITEAEINFPYQFSDNMEPLVFTQLGFNGSVPVLYWDIPVSDARPEILFSALKEMAIAAAKINTNR